MRAFALLAVLALSACASTPADRPPERWALQASATAGSALIVEDGQGEALRIACRRNPAGLLVTTGRMKGDGSGATLRVGDETFALAPQAQPAGLAATSPLPAALPAALMGGKAVSLSQGGRTLGPYPGPDQQTAAAFAIACRGAG